MKTAVLQLARLGDIYQTWPVLRALKRADPNGELHLITREKFIAAAPRAPIVDRLWTFSTKDVLQPLIDERPNLDDSLQKLAQFTDELREQGFDRVINLTFSPFSSYMAREISGPCTEVHGYTRFSDGSLSVPDDGSAYFYAQVGVDRPNRIHVTDLFAYVARVDLASEDWAQLPTKAMPESEVLPLVGDDAIAIHIGASHLGKTFGWSKWTQIVRGLLNSHGGSVILIGAQEESELAQRIATMVGTDGAAILNLVGRTQLPELVEVVRKARLLIGGDSGPVQIASLVGTPVLNVSFPMVSFWETGPRSAGSRILRLESEDDVPSDMIVREAMAMLNDEGTVLPCVRVTGPLFPYIEARPQENFEWEMVRALYMGEAFPAPPTDLCAQGLLRLFEVNQLAREQIEALRKNPSNKTATQILDRVDDVMTQITRMVPEVGALVRWFETERMRIGPMSVGHLIEATDGVHRRLEEVLSLYCGSTVNVSAEGDAGHDDVVLG